MTTAEVTRIENRLADVGFEEEALRDDVEGNRLTRAFHIATGPGQSTFSETLKPRQVLNLAAFVSGKPPFKGTERAALTEARRRYPTAITERGRVRPEFVLDDVVTELGPRYRDTDGVERFLKDIEAAGRQRQALREVRAEARGLSDDLAAAKRKAAQAPKTPRFRAKRPKRFKAPDPLTVVSVTESDGTKTIRIQRPAAARFKGRRRAELINVELERAAREDITERELLQEQRRAAR